MKKLFKKTVGVLSTEMIEPQVNDYVVVALQKEFKLIIESIRDYKFNNTNDMFKNKIIYNIICNIDTLLSERFGFRFKHVANNNHNYGVMPVPPNNVNILYTDMQERFDNTKQHLEYLNKNNSAYKTTEQIKYMQFDSDDMLQHWYNSVKAIDKTMMSDKVIVDLKKAKINNLPNEYVVFIQADLYNLITDNNINENELTAILLHEVGHAFSVIEYSYRSIVNTSVLLDSLRDNMSKKNKSFKDSLILAYEHTYSEKLDKNVTTSKIALLHILEKHIDKNTAMNKVPHGYTDMEQLADQFAARFGTHSDLVSGLNKFYINYEDNKIYNKITMFSLMYILPMLYFSIIIIILTGLISAGLAFVGGYTLLVAILYIIQAVSSDGNMLTGQTYDDSIRRITRIKNDMVRQLRLNGSSFDKDVITNILASITNVDNILTSLPKIDNATYVDKFIRNYTTAGKHAFKLKLTEQLIEDLMENNIHVAAYKIKDIK